MRFRRALSRALPVMCLALLTVPVVERAVAAGDPVLVGAGDIANCNGAGDESTAALLDKIPGTVFTLGDNVYPTATANRLLTCFGPSWGRHKARMRPAIGNHDYLPSGAPGYYDYFGAAAGIRAKGYYSYDRGSWHVVVLNSNCGRVDGCGPGSPQEQWLRADLAAHKAQCTVAYWHHARFSSGSHGSDPNYQAFWSALYDFGADVVMSGHDHLYERFGPQTPDGGADAAFGIRQFTVGTGGASHYNFRPKVLPNSQVRNTGTFGVLKLTLHAGSYDWRFVPAGAGTFTDSGTASCHGKPPPSPPTPPTTGPIPPTTRPTPPTTAPTPTNRILFRAAASDASNRPRNSVTVARPSGTKAGDVMVGSVVVNDNDALTVPDGWTLVREDVVQNTLRQNVYYRVATASDPSSFTWSIGRDRRLVGGIVSYAGVDTARPVDAHDATTDKSAGTALTAPSVTSTTSGGLLLALMAVNSDGAISPPSGLTERWEGASLFPGTPRSVTAEWSDDPLGAAGPTGKRRATTTVAGPSIAALLALRPAP